MDLKNFKMSDNLSSKIYQMYMEVTKVNNAECPLDTLKIENRVVPVQTVRSSKKKLCCKHLDKYRKKKKKNKGKVYPVDLWFILSDYILPKDVGTFARICKASHYVTTTRLFWLRLRRFTCASPHWLPVKEDNCVCFSYEALRFHIIRNLRLLYFHVPYMYTFDSTLQSRMTMNYSWPKLTLTKRPESLIGMKCVDIWSIQTATLSTMDTTRWQYFLKLEKAPYKFYKKLLGFNEVNWLERHYITEDVESNCRLIKISSTSKCEDFISVSGQILRKIVIKDVSYQFYQGYPFVCCKLQLKFRKPNSGFQSTQMTFEKVEEFRIMDWWDANYSMQ